MVEFSKEDSRRAIAEKRKQFEARLIKIRQEEERLKQRHDDQSRPRKKQVCHHLKSRQLSVLIADGLHLASRADSNTT